MTSTDVISVCVEVAIDPITAFAVFTEEIGQWWRPGPINWNDADRAIGMRIEPGIGGRWLEVYDAVTGEGFECGRVRVWEPGVRFICTYHDIGHDIDGTEIEVRFDPIAGGTRVTLEHRGWETVATALLAKRRSLKRVGWTNILGWFSEWAFWGSPKRISKINEPTNIQGYVLHSDEGTTADDPSLKASRISTGGSITLIESQTTGGAPRHVHSREDECFYVIAGTIKVECGNDVFEAGPRAFVFLPRGVPHAWDVVGDGHATVLIITVPGGFEDFLRDYHLAGAADNQVKDQVAARYGLT